MMATGMLDQSSKDVLIRDISKVVMPFMDTQLHSTSLEAASSKDDRLDVNKMQVLLKFILLTQRASSKFLRKSAAYEDFRAAFTPPHLYSLTNPVKMRSSEKWLCASNVII